MAATTHLMCASKKGISAHQLFRMLGFGSYRTAWFMAHRIREAMKPAPFAEPMGGDGGAVEVDETFIGRDILNPPMPEAKSAIANMNKVCRLWTGRRAKRAHSWSKTFACPRSFRL